MHIGDVCWQNCRQQRHSTVTTVLALATLGTATQIGLFQFFVASPKVAKASTRVLLSRVIFTGVIMPTFANVNIA